MCQKSQRQSKRRNKRKSVTMLGSSSFFYWWLRSSGGQHASSGLGLLMVGTHSKGLAPSPFIPFRCSSHNFPEVLKNESVGMGGGGGGVVSWWSHIPPPKASAQLPCLCNIGGFCKLTPCLCWVSLSLPCSLIKMRRFPKHNVQFRSLIQASLSVSPKTDV